MNIFKKMGLQWGVVIAVFFWAEFFLFVGLVSVHAEVFSPSKVYKKQCAVCHGVKGDGQSMAGRGMNPPPTDFTAPESSARLTPTIMLETLKKGKPGTAMIAWKELFSEGQMKQLVSYIQDHLMPSVRNENASLGRRLYAKNCSVCHGDKGDTAVWAQGGLTPSPRDFTSDRSKRELSLERMKFSILYGRPNTAMPVWKDRFNEEEVLSLIHYIRGAFIWPGGEDQEKSWKAKQGQSSGGGHQHNHFERAEMAKPMPHGLVGDGVLGKRFYEESCATCHGKTGDGKGPRSHFIFPKPRNFLHTSSLYKFSREHLFNVISEGVLGTEMPAWKRVLTQQEIANISEYLFEAFISPRLPEGFLVEAGKELAARAPMNHSEGHSMDHSMGHSADSSTKHPAGHSMDHSADSSMKHPAGHSMDHSVDGSMKHPAGHSMDHSADASMKHPAGHSMDHSAGHNHPGLPFLWILPLLIAMPLVSVWAIRRPILSIKPARTLNLSTLPLIGPIVRFLNRTPQPLALIKLISVAFYLLVIYAGLFGVEWPERNFATVMVWGFWWPLVIISVFFLGSAWCAICPWETLSKLLVFRRLWRRPPKGRGSVQKVPAKFRNIWPALFLFAGLTWLELGVGVTSIPFATALMALLMLIFATLGLLFFERKAFCRYFCPVGRTIGYYSRLAPIELRPQNEQVCAECKTLECYNGSEDLEPCPSHLTLGRFAQNTFCLSCGSCVLSCPHHNVSWRLRTMGSEAAADARPLWDGSWFMLGLLGITIFHGVTMMSFWNEWITMVSSWFGETGRPTITFLFLMWFFFLIPALVYGVAVKVVQLMNKQTIDFKQLFNRMAFSALPLAFTYHLAHNVDHFFRESSGLWEVFKNPLGSGMLPMTASERHLVMMQGGLPDPILFFMQIGLMGLGFWLAVQIVRYRSFGAMKGGANLKGLNLWPLLLFVVGITCFNLWLLGQDMVMRL